MIYNNSPPFLQYEKHCHCLCSIAVYLYVLYIKTHCSVWWVYSVVHITTVYMYHGFIEMMCFFWGGGLFWLSLFQCEVGSYSPRSARQPLWTKHTGYKWKKKEMKQNKTIKWRKAKKCLDVKSIRLQKFLLECCWSSNIKKYSSDMFRLMFDDNTPVCTVPCEVANTCTHVWAPPTPSNARFWQETSFC